jgi:predicted TIM-barrel fold metal-dependent hydrolase
MEPEATGIDQDRVIVISSDGHTCPPIRRYRDYIEQRHYAAFDTYAALVEAYDRESERLLTARRQALIVDGSDSQHHRVIANINDDTMPGLWDPSARMRDVEAEGCVGEVLFPQGSVPFAPYPSLAPTDRPGIIYQADLEMVKCGVRAYNRWLADFTAVHPGRMAGIAVLPIDDIHASVKEVEWARDAGLIGGVSLPPITDKRMYHDPAYEPLWSACESLSMPLNVHGGGFAPFYGYSPEAPIILLAETDWWVRRPLWFLVFGGVFERHPGLRLVFTEQRAHWLAPLMNELDSLFENRRARGQQTIPRKPSSYIMENVFIGASFLARHEIDGAPHVAAEKFMWGADYPHSEGTWPWSLPSIRRNVSGLPDGDIKAMLGGNAMRCYELLDGKALRAAADLVGPTISEIQEPWEGQPPEGAERSWGFRENIYS